MQNHAAPSVSGSAVGNSFSYGTARRDFKFEWPASVWFNLAISGIVGFLYALYLLGPRVLNPHNISWLWGDTATHYIGWALFRQDHSIHWPITYTDRIGYPIGDSIALMDLNPLLAILLRPLSPLLPEPFQYLGLEAGLVCTLQFFFALRLFRLLLGSNPLAVVLPGLYFLVSPIMALRLGFGHGALSNQWLLTAALFLFLLAHRNAPIPMRRFVCLALVLAAISVSINPYLAFQVLLILATAIIGLLWRGRLSFYAASGALIALGMISLATAYLFGFIIPGGRGYGAGGYRSYSMNLLSPFDPNIFGSLLLRPVSHVGEGQYEGYNYLGAGVILLVIASVLVVIACRSILPRLQWGSVIPLLLCCFLLALLSLSTYVTLGSKALIDLDPGQRLSPFFSPLRCSGRLFWTPYYTVLIAILAIPYRFLNRRRASVLVSIALAVQLIDLIPLQQQMRFGINQRPETPLKSAVWSRLGSTYQNLIVMPPWQCGPDGSPGGANGFATFGLLAAAQRMRINSYYTGRQTGINLDFHCGQSRSNFTKEPLSPASAYVVVPAIAAALVSSGSGKCHNLDGFALCSARDNFGLGAALWQSPTELWVISQFEAILMRGPSDPELRHWTDQLDRGMRSQADFIVALLTSAEFEHTPLPRFWAYLDRQGRWPTFSEWVGKDRPRPEDSKNGNPGGKRPLHDRNRAIVCTLYFALLRRDPDATGLSTWPAALTRMPLHEVALQFLNSPEYKAHPY